MAAASPTVSTDTCNAKTRTDRPCRNRAGYKTSHPGVGRCTFHGGSSPNGEIQAARLTAARLGAELQMDPAEALLLMVRRAAGAERYWAGMVADLNDDEIVKQHVRTRDWHGNGQNETGGHETITEAHSDVHVLVREHQRSIDQLARVAKTALDAGVEERRVRLAEQLHGDIADVLDVVLTQLGVRDHPDAAAVIRRALHAVEAPALEAA